MARDVTDTDRLSPALLTRLSAVPRGWARTGFQFGLYTNLEYYRVTFTATDDAGIRVLGDTDTGFKIAFSPADKGHFFRHVIVSHDGTRWNTFLNALDAAEVRMERYADLHL